MYSYDDFLLFRRKKIIKKNVMYTLYDYIFIYIIYTTIAYII